MSTLKQQWLKVPDNHMDHQLLPIIERWDDQPTALQILELLDACIYNGAASRFVVGALEGFLTAAMNNEGVTHEQLVAQATWRKQ